MTPPASDRNMRKRSLPSIVLKFLALACICSSKSKQSLLLVRAFPFQVFLPSNFPSGNVGTSGSTQNVAGGISRRRRQEEKSTFLSSQRCIIQRSGSCCPSMVKHYKSGSLFLSTSSSSASANPPSFNDRSPTTSTTSIMTPTEVITSSLVSTDDSKESIIDCVVYNETQQTASSLSPEFREDPPLTFDKFLTMQDKRVEVTICYSSDSGLRPYFLSAAKRIKAAFPDVLIERRILPSVSNNRNEGSEDFSIFEILVDGKEIIGKNRSNRNVKFGSSSSKGSLNKKIAFVSMENLEFAISRARRRRRPSTSYVVTDGGEQPTKLGILTSNHKKRGQAVRKIHNKHEKVHQLRTSQD